MAKPKFGPVTATERASIKKRVRNRSPDAIRRADPAKRKPNKKGMGAQKGASFERLMAKQFSAWISNGASTDLLWRSAGSGGRSTMRRKQTGRGIDYHASDIAPLHPDAAPFSDLFTLECKSYKSASLHQLFYTPLKSLVASWWKQACTDAEGVSRVPLLVVKQNGYEPLLVLTSKYKGHDELAWRRVHAMLTLNDVPWVLVESLELYVVRLALVFKQVPFKEFRDAFLSPRRQVTRVVLRLPSDTDDRPTPHRKPT